MHSLSLLSLVLAFTSLASGAAISNWHGPTQGWSSVVARAPSGASLRSRRLISLMQLDEGQTEFISKTSDGVRRSIVPQKFNLHSGSVPFITYGVGKRSMITEPFSHHDWNTLNGPITKRDVVSAGVGKRSMITQPFSHHDWNAVSGSITKRGIIAPPAGNHFVGWKGVGIVARDDLEARSIMPPPPGSRFIWRGVANAVAREPEEWSDMVARSILPSPKNSHFIWTGIQRSDEGIAAREPQERSDSEAGEAHMVQSSSMLSSTRPRIGTVISSY